MITTTSTNELYNQYKETMRKIADIRYSAALLQWDQETYLPQKGAAIRGQQIATLTEIAHRFFTEEHLGNLVRELQTRNDLTEKEKRNVELTLEDYTKQKKFTSEFVRTLTEAVNKSFHSWLQARKENDFTIFSGDLSTLINLKKQEAEFLGYENHPYNALLNDFDKGSNVGMLDAIFTNIKQPLKDILQKIVSQPQVDDSFLQQHYPKEKQWQFGLQVLKDFGYDFNAGRQDISEHPFTINFNSNDVRITTRVDENDLGNMIWSCIHELGHALYEQGLPEDEYGLPLGEPASLTIHESQSRLWENHIGRSLGFCERYFPLLQQYFPEQLQKVSTDQFYKGINKVQPSFIRTEADEVTYHFHVMIRYEIEKQLIGGSINTADIPAYWNSHYKEFLGVTVPDDKKGCLQDVHWSHGSFGYFPTYSLGSFCAAQLYKTAAHYLPSIQNDITKGDTKPLLMWLRNEVHTHGRMFNSEDLCRKVSGEVLNTKHFIGYLLNKYSEIYKL